MVLQLLNEKGKGDCSFEVYNTEKKEFSSCNDDSVMKSGQKKLCERHGMFVASNAKVQLKDSSGNNLNKELFLKELKEVK